MALFQHEIFVPSQDRYSCVLIRIASTKRPLLRVGYLRDASKRVCSHFNRLYSFPKMVLRSFVRSLFRKFFDKLFSLHRFYSLKNLLKRIRCMFFFSLKIFLLFYFSFLFLIHDFFYYNFLFSIIFY